MQRFFGRKGARCKLENTSHPVGKVRTPNTCTTESCVYLRQSLFFKKILNLYGYPPVSWAAEIIQVAISYTYFHESRYLSMTATFWNASIG